VLLAPLSGANQHEGLSPGHKYIFSVFTAKERVQWLQMLSYFC